MEALSVVRSRDQERGHEESIFEDDRSSRRDPDSSTANLLVPSRPQSQHFLSHDNQAHDSQQTHTPPLWRFFWWLLTIILCALIFAVIKEYESKGIITSVQKHTFNTISTALILGLGLNFFVNHHAHDITTWVEINLSVATQEAFKSLAKGSRSRLLKQKNHSLGEKDLLSNIENLTDVVRLGWASLIKPRTRPWTALLCIAWVRSSSTGVHCHISPLLCLESLLE